jgi:hypothetical protein
MNLCAAADGAIARPTAITCRRQSVLPEGPFRNSSGLANSGGGSEPFTRRGERFSEAPAEWSVGSETACPCRSGVARVYAARSGGKSQWIAPINVPESERFLTTCDPHRTGRPVRTGYRWRVLTYPAEHRTIIASSTMRGRTSSRAEPYAV